jgi:hypothetical protein
VTTAALVSVDPASTITLKQITFVPHKDCSDAAQTFSAQVLACPVLSRRQLNDYALLLDNCSHDKMHIVGVESIEGLDGDVTLQVTVDICPQVYKHIVVLMRLIGHAQAIVPGLMLGELSAMTG